MKISEKMAEAAWTQRATLWGAKRNSRAGISSIVQAAIDEAWTRFDPEDKETWPKSTYAPSHKMWACVNSNGDIENCVFTNPRNFDWGEVGITKYADPADLMSQEGET